MLLLANSLIDGYFASNFIGKGIVLIQLAFSVWMVQNIIAKYFNLRAIIRKTKEFRNAFSSFSNVIDYYRHYRPGNVSGIERIYKDTAERLVKVVLGGERARGAECSTRPEIKLTAHEIELIRGVSAFALDEEIIALEKEMTPVATVVSLAPMLGLLGTVWGVLDAFAEMGQAGSANLATIAPSIASALVTTVVGLIIAMPGVAAYNYLDSIIRKITSEFEGFADEIISRLACEYQKGEDIVCQ